MNMAKFIRWANRREKAEACLYEAQRHVRDMLKVSSVSGVAEDESVRALDAVAEAIAALASALELATETGEYRR